MSEFACIICLCACPPACCTVRRALEFRETLFFETSVNRNYAVNSSVSRFGCFISVFGCLRRFWILVVFLVFLLRVGVDLFTKVFWAKVALWKWITWQLNRLMCCTTFGMWQMGGSHESDRASSAYVCWCGNHVQKICVWRLWMDANMSIGGCPEIWNLKKNSELPICWKSFRLSNLDSAQMVC